jgi:hypothetical protein
MAKSDDERQAEIEAVARAIYDTQENGVPWDSETLDDWRKDYEREKARAAIAMLDRVRDARGDDERSALNQTRCSGCTEAVKDEEPLRFRSGVLWHEACLARSPQDEDDEELIRNLLAAWLNGWEPGENQDLIDLAERAIG